LDVDNGWPAYTAPISQDCLRTEEDLSWFERRTDVRCAACDAHLGHMAGDGAVPAHICINSSALRFEQEKQ